MEDYLEAIFVLSKDRGYARTCEIAKTLKVSPSSVVEMVGKIAKINLVIWKRYEGVYLTPQGRIHGEIVHIRHETLRRFFEFIGVSHEIADTEACIIEHELSPVTTTAIGNLVRFLETPSGVNTCKALNIFIKMQDAGIPWNEPAESALQVSSVEMQGSIKEKDQNFQILSALTRHDLLNALTALYGYLDLMREHDSGNGTGAILTRIESIVSSMHRQISGSSDLLIPGSMTKVWLNLGQLIERAAESLETEDIQLKNNLHDIEIYADPILEKVAYNLIENSIRHGEPVRNISCDYRYEGSDLIWCIRDDGSGIDHDKKHAIFRPKKGRNSGIGLAIVDQILSSGGMQIEEQGFFGKGAAFVIRVPPPLFRKNSSIIPLEESGDTKGQSSNF